MENSTCPILQTTSELPLQYSRRHLEQPAKPTDRGYLALSSEQRYLAVRQLYPELKIIVLGLRGRLCSRVVSLRVRVEKVPAPFRSPRDDYMHLDAFIFDLCRFDNNGATYANTRCK